MPSPDAALDLFDPAELRALALRAMHRGQLEDALRLLKTALRRPSGEARQLGELLYLQATVHAQLDLTDRAIDGLRQALAAAPGLVQARFQLGLLHFSAQQAEAAVAAWQPMHGQLGDGEPLRLFAAGLSQLCRGDAAGAVPLLEQGLARSSNEGLNEDMRALLAQARQAAGAAPAAVSAGEPAAPRHVLLSGYARQQEGGEGALLV